MDMVGQNGGAGGEELGAAVSFIAGWMAMMLVMMLPSLLPMLSTYRRSVRAGQAGRARRLGIQTTLVGAGYFGVWLIVGAAMYLLGDVLAAAGIRWSVFAASVPITSGVVLLLAGCIQFSAWKARHLGRCFAAPSCGRLMEPTTRSAARGARNAARHGAGSAARHGLELGVHCTLSCASFMMILLATGAMELGAMAAVTAAITAERLAPSPARAARVAGVVVLVAGALVIVHAFVVA